MDQRTRKLMTMHKALHPRYEVERLYVSRKQRRGLASIEDSVDASIQRPEDYIEKHGGGLITATRNDTDNTKTNRMTITRKQEYEEKQQNKAESEKKDKYLNLARELKKLWNMKVTMAPIVISVFRNVTK